MEEICYLQLKDWKSNSQRSQMKFVGPILSINIANPKYPTLDTVDTDSVSECSQLRLGVIDKIKDSPASIKGFGINSKIPSTLLNLELELESLAPSSTSNSKFRLFEKV